MDVSHLKLDSGLSVYAVAMEFHLLHRYYQLMADEGTYRQMTCSVLPQLYNEGDSGNKYVYN